MGKWRPNRPSVPTIFTPEQRGPFYVVRWKRYDEKLKVFQKIELRLLEPKRFVDVDKTDIRSLKRGVGVKYHLQRTSKRFCRGVVLARRGLDLFIYSFGNKRNRNMILRIVSIGVYHPSWNNYEFRRVMARLARLERFAQDNERLNKVLQLLWKKSDGYTFSDSSFSAEARQLANEDKLLSDEGHIVVTQYAGWLNQLRRVQKQLSVK